MYFSMKQILVMNETRSYLKSTQNNGVNFKNMYSLKFIISQSHHFYSPYFHIIVSLHWVMHWRLCKCQFHIETRGMYIDFLLDASYHIFIARSLTFPRHKGQMCGKVNTKVFWVTLILSILFILAFDQVEVKVWLTFNSGPLWQYLEYDFI